MGQHSHTEIQIQPGHRSVSAPQFLVSNVCSRRGVIYLLCLLSVVAFVLYDGIHLAPVQAIFAPTTNESTKYGRVIISGSINPITTSSVQSTQPLTRYNLTIVTAFFDIGEFGKGSPSNKRDHRIYEKWSSAYSMIRSPIVFYTDSQEFGRHILDVRKHLPDLTRVVLVNRSQLWSFQQKENIAAIYQAGYPRHWPNTVYPDYTCVTHAKFDVVEDAILKGYAPSDHVVWMDAGYLRGKTDEAANQTREFYYVMEPPMDFDPNRIMCGEIFQPHFNQSWRDIFRRNKNWVGGGFFLGRVELMLKFVRQYKKAVRLFLERGESNVEQHVIYATYTKGGRDIVKPEVELQAVRGSWFTLGLRCLVKHTL